MRAKVVAAIAGLVVTVGGIGLLGYGITRLSGAPAYYRCVGDDCLNDPWFLAFPGGIIAMVFGLIIASWALGSLRQERASIGPLRAFGFMTGLGGVFFAMGAIFLVASGLPKGGTDATFLFLGGLFGIMGIGFIAIDLLRFRGELKKDRLRVSGLKGTARVVGVSDSNITINNNPMVNLDLDVNVPGQPPFRTRKRVVISRLSVGALAPGATIAVLADPAKPQDIVIDWDAEASSAGAGEAGAVANAVSAVLPGTLGAFTNLRVIPGTVNAEILRSVSQALANAAARADHGGTVTRTPDGTTVIDGGTTITVNGTVLRSSELGGLLGGLPAAIAAALGAPGVAGGNPPPATGVPGAASGAASSVVDVPVPGSSPSANALPARVTLDAIQDTGVDMAGNRLYAFDLTVLVAGREPYQTKHAAVVPRAQIARLMRGASFPASVDPDQRDQISIHWDG
jgi:hypothetical protein